MPAGGRHGHQAGLDWCGLGVCYGLVCICACKAEAKHAAAAKKLAKKRASQAKIKHVRKSIFPSIIFHLSGDSRTECQQEG